MERSYAELLEDAMLGHVTSLIPFQINSLRVCKGRGLCPVNVYNSLVELLTEDNLSQEVGGIMLRF